MKPLRLHLGAVAETQHGHPVAGPSDQLVVRGEHVGERVLVRAVPRECQQVRGSGRDCIAHVLDRRRAAAGHHGCPQPLRPEFDGVGHALREVDEVGVVLDGVPDQLAHRGDDDGREVQRGPGSQRADVLEEGARRRETDVEQRGVELPGRVHRADVIIESASVVRCGASTRSYSLCTVQNSHCTFEA